MDYSNSILAGCSNYILNILQRVQNIAAKLVLKRGRYSSSKALMDLHWLPVKARIKYKILTIVYKCFHGFGPSYLQNLFCKIQNKDLRLRSAKRENILLVPRLHNKTLAERSFSVFGVFGPKRWNLLPDNIRTEGNFEKFKSNLKTHLFREYNGLNSQNSIYVYY